MFTVFVYIANSRKIKLYKTIHKKNIEIQGLEKAVESKIVQKEIDTESASDKDFEVFSKVVGLMDEKHYITNPNLSLNDMTKLIGVNHLYISSAINNISGKNFNRFVNGYRIEEAQRILLDKNSKNLTLEEIAKQSGFSSPNTFYRHFKDITGLTPKEFQKANS
jgi:YesN/AraC family two-component response regulator